ncbi:MAG: sporulation transcriptional regulator SpoIIID [Lachnospiraceae bacterium]|nr:sporulation transcriptional regulator SpoIIID [Lachnospiraceae bacterium]
MDTKTQRKTKTTIKKNKLRQARKHPKPKPFQIPTTIHKDVSERLNEIDGTLAAKVRKVLDTNKAERHIRGGMATKEKYLNSY